MSGEAEPRSGIWSVPIPEGAEPPFTVFVNGAPRHQDTDFTVEGRWIRFPKPLRSPPKLGFGAKVMLSIGIGVYGDLKADSVDLQYHVGGRPRIATGLPVIPPQDPGEDPPPG
jgi:hypothetical protein